MEKIKVYIKKGEVGLSPVYQSRQSAGCDVFATKDLVLRPGERAIMPLDFIFALEDGIEAQVRPRSGLSLKTTLRIANSPGTIDTDYRDEVGVIIENTYNPSNIAYKASQDEEFAKKLESEYKTKSYLGQSLFFDSNDNPIGTIYIKKGERIAQMVFCKYVQADFIDHDNPEKIGHNRGGGFGHSGR